MDGRPLLPRVTYQLPPPPVVTYGRVPHDAYHHQQPPFLAMHPPPPRGFMSAPPPLFNHQQQPFSLPESRLVHLQQLGLKRMRPIEDSRNDEDDEDDENEYKRARKEIRSRIPTPSNVLHHFNVFTSMPRNPQGPVYYVTIKYKYAGDGDDEQCMFSRYLVKFTDAEFLLGSQITDLLRLDHVNIHMLREIRVYEKGVNEARSGWLLLRGDYLIPLRTEKKVEKIVVVLELHPLPSD